MPTSANCPKNPSDVRADVGIRATILPVSQQPLVSEVEDGERRRLDRSRRRLADELAALAPALQTVSGTCRTSCSARCRTERPGRSRSPVPTA